MWLWERMNSEPAVHRHRDDYDMFQMAVTLLRMSARADREARARRGAAELSRQLGKLYDRTDDFDVVADKMQEAAARAAACAHRMREMASRLTGLTGWGAGAVLDGGAGSLP